MSTDEKQTETPRPIGVGHNNPPLARAIAAEEGDFAATTMAFLDEEYGPKWRTTVADLLAEATTLMRDADGKLKPISDDETKALVTSLIKRFRDTAKSLNGLHDKEKQPYLRGGQAVDQFFYGLVDQCARRDKKNRPGAADVLNDMLTDYDRRKLAEEQERRRAEAAEAARIAREKEAAELKALQEAEQRRLEAERARKPETKEVKAEIATAAEQEASAAVVETTVAAARAQDAHMATLARPADIMRTRGADGTLSTMKQEPYAEIVDRDKLDRDKLWPYIPLEALQRALNAYAKTTDYTVPMEGASIGRRPKSVVR